MILADTSIWIDHFHKGDAEFGAHLDAGEVLIHPFVIGELAVGNLSSREGILRALSRLPAANVARHEEILALISRERLYGLGLGYVDVALLASVRLTPDAWLRTRDRRLQTVADRLAAF
ncbi:PIN domain-containing protein [Phenylobacterium sp.]|uniref:type II toxin-antitoxin system VapC family toxin n=1 Tax=Phenylobacterium sp. TaxID=1871053 RepID=UPI001201AC26|nr:PIN domain-containing protein [Phenylobacterium sp.]THD50790.1 MAG: VapC toxin family PIN domain ribonuclease [Phenylobacterium sp.]